MSGQAGQAAPSAVVVLLGTDSMDAGLLKVWEEACLSRSLERLGKVFCWGSGQTESMFPTLSSMRQLHAMDVDLLIWMDATQVFLDVEVIVRGLSSTDFSIVDHLTQWAHCRIPLGVGARISKRSVLERLDVASPEEWLELVDSAPCGVRVRYDTQALVDFEESRLDARWSSKMADCIQHQAPQSWGMTGWKEWVSRLSATERSRLQIEPDANALRVDERGVRAPYGFESIHCGHFPTYVMFDITNLCNARCIHCPQSIVGPDGEKPEYLAKVDHIPMEDYRAVIDECAEHGVDFVRITADGEPLVHKGLIEMVQYAQKRGVGPVALTTNGSLVNAKRAEALLDAGLGMVDFSLDAHQADTFHQIRVGLSFERTIANVHRFIEMRDVRGSDCRVMVSFVKQTLNVDEAQRFRDYWSPLVDEVLVREMTSNVGLNTPSVRQIPVQATRWPCPHFFRRIVVNHLGRVKACPIDWRQATTNLSVGQASLYAQWHGDFYWHHRLQHLNDEIPKTSPCSPCTDWSSTPWSLGYEKVVARLTAGEERA